MPERMDSDEWRRSKVAPWWACRACGEHMLNDHCSRGVRWPIGVEDGRVVWSGAT